MNERTLTPHKQRAPLLEIAGGYTSKELFAAAKGMRDRERSKRRAVYKEAGRPGISLKVSLIIWSAVWAQAIITAATHHPHDRTVNLASAIFAVAQRGVYFRSAARKPGSKDWSKKQPSPEKMSKPRSRSYVESHFYEIENRRQPRDADAPLYAKPVSREAIRADFEREYLESGKSQDLKFSDADVDAYLAERAQRRKEWDARAGERFDEWLADLIGELPWQTNLGAPNYGPSLFLDALRELQNRKPGGLRFHFAEGGMLAPQLLYVLIFGDWRLSDAEDAAIKDELLPARHWGLGDDGRWTKPAPELGIGRWSHK